MCSVHCTCDSNQSATPRPSPSHPDRQVAHCSNFINYGRELAALYHIPLMVSGTVTGQLVEDSLFPLHMHACTERPHRPAVASCAMPYSAARGFPADRQVCSGSRSSAPYSHRPHTTPHTSRLARCLPEPRAPLARAHCLARRDFVPHELHDTETNAISP